MSIVPPVQMSSPDDSLGAVMLGTFISLIIYGVTLHQVYRYLRLFPRDSRILKTLVVFVLILDTTTSAFSILVCYVDLIQDAYKPIELLNSSWSIDVLPLCWSFFAWRVWRVA
ncbi:hypothetical protein GY45DRAFT_1310549, partial [Cubamyces sp. BRFM 1775]